MQIGGYIGAYRLEQPIGEGGMGAVWKARHPTLDRPVALKLIRSEVQASPQAREAFLREVRVLSRLHGPQILQVTDFGFTEAGDPYMVTEFLEGEDLLARVRRLGPLDPADVVPIGIEVLKALAEAHAVGLVHRDLKPGNVFLQKLAGGARTAVKVLDFGVAKLLEGGEEDTLWPGARLKGSPRYMAPEQVQGGLITPATDIYAFGAMLYRVLTGAPVFAGDRNAVLRGHIGQPPPPMNSRGPGLGISGELEDIVQGCLEKAPADRPGSAGALQARMERLARRLRDARGDDGMTPSGVALDWSADGGVGESSAGSRSTGSLPVLTSRGTASTGPGEDVDAWFRTTGSQPDPIDHPESDGAPAISGGWGIDPPPAAAAPTGGWQLDLPDAAGSTPTPSSAPALQPDPAPSAASGADLGGWGIEPPAAEVPEQSSPEPSPPVPPPALAADAPDDPDTAGLELDLSQARKAPVAGSMSGVQIRTGGLELETADDDGGLELAFEPMSRGSSLPETPDTQGAPDTQGTPDTPAEPAASEPSPGEVDAASRPEAERSQPPRSARSSVRSAAAGAGITAPPWHEQHRVALIAGCAVLGLLLLVWIGRSALIDSAGVLPPDAAPVVDAAPRKLDLGVVPVALDRGTAMLEAPSVARGPASHNGAPGADQRPTVLIRPDPAPATFTRRDDGQVVCEEAATCRVPIDVDIVITRKGYRRLVLQGDDLYDRRGSTWRVILRR